MIDKHTLDKKTKNIGRLLYNYIRPIKHYIFILLLLVFSLLMLSEITLERVIMYISSLIAISCAIRKNNEIKKLKQSLYKIE